jgi:hypothetical protein
MPKHDTAIIREAFRREGLGGQELEAAVLAYRIANNWPLDNATGADAIAAMKGFITTYLRGTSERKIN